MTVLILMGGGLAVSEEKKSPPNLSCLHEHLFLVYAKCIPGLTTLWGRFFPSVTQESCNISGTCSLSRSSEHRKRDHGELTPPLKCLHTKYFSPAVTHIPAMHSHSWVTSRELDALPVCPERSGGPDMAEHCKPPSQWRWASNFIYLTRGLGQRIR